MDLLPPSELKLRAARPKGFKPALGVVEAGFLNRLPPKGLRGRANTASQKAGKRYEARALEHLALLFPKMQAQPWLEFTDLHGRRLCQPDALAAQASFAGSSEPEVLIFEIKLGHNIMAYWQLRRLYQPVISILYPDCKIRVCEIVKSFDPAVPWPEEVALCMGFEELHEVPADRFAVWQWRPG